MYKVANFINVVMSGSFLPVSYAAYVEREIPKSEAISSCVYPSDVRCSINLDANLFSVSS